MDCMQASTSTSTNPPASFGTTSVQNPMFQAPSENTHPNGQFYNQSMSLGTQQLTLLEILCSDDKPHQSMFQASDPGKAARLTPDIDLSPPILPPDVIMYLESLPTQDDETQPAYGYQPPAMISNADAAFTPLPHYQEQYEYGGPQGFPSPTMPNYGSSQSFPASTKPNYGGLHCFPAPTMQRYGVPQGFAAPTMPYQHQMLATFSFGFSSYSWCR